MCVCMCDVCAMCVCVCVCCVWDIIEAGYYTRYTVPSTCRYLNSLNDNAI